MFSNSNCDVYSFNSNWKKNYSKSEFTTQTDTYKIVHRGLNIKKHRNKECQTDLYLYVEEDLRVDIDESELNEFVRRVTPKIYEVLISNERTCVFNAQPTNGETNDESICLHIIENIRDSSSVTNVSQLSWNSNGTVLAAAFGDTIHNKWCVHTNTGVGIFSLSTRNKANLKDKPDILLETTTCACCVQFHNKLTSLIAAGTHNGELVVWDRSRSDNDLVLATNSENKVHEEAIISALWLTSSADKSISSNLRMISMAIDGTIVMWNLSMRKSTLVPLNCYNLTARDLPKSVRYKGSLSKNLSILCGTVNPLDNEYVVVGVDVGVLFLCQIRSKGNSSLGSEIKEIKSPVDSILATVSGAVHAVQWSKVIPNFLATTIANGIIHVYNVELKQQIFTIDPGQGYLYDLSLSSLMLGIIATSGENGTVVLTDFLEHGIGTGLDLFNSETHATNSGNSVLTCPTKAPEDSLRILYCVEFNDININYLATSDINGTIYIWNLSQQLVDKHSKIRLHNLESYFGSFRNDN